MGQPFSCIRLQQTTEARELPLACKNEQHVVANGGVPGEALQHRSDGGNIAAQVEGQEESGGVKEPLITTLNGELGRERHAAGQFSKCSAGSIFTPTTRQPMISSNGVSLLLSGSCGLDATGKEALARIGNSAGLQELMSPFEILADAKLTHVLGTGGHATVFAGLWQGHTPVAIKISATGATLQQGLPSQFLAEAVLSRSLSHPHIIRTHAVRCAVLDPSFLAHVFPSNLEGPPSNRSRLSRTALGPALKARSSQQSSTVLGPGLTHQQGSDHCTPTPAFARLSIPEGMLYEEHGRRANAPEAYMMPMQDGQDIVAQVPVVAQVHLGHDHIQASIVSAIDNLAPAPQQQHGPAEQQPLMDRGTNHPLKFMALLDSGSIHTTPQDLTGKSGKSLTPLSQQEMTNTLSGKPKSVHWGPLVAPDEFESTLDLAWMADADPLTWADILGHVKGWAEGEAVTVMVLDWARMGSLWQALKRGALDTRPSSAGTRLRQHLQLRALLKTAKEVAAALEYLHRSGVIHGDVKPANILLNESCSDARGFTAALGDFGLASLLGHYHQTGSPHYINGTLPFLAPELLQKGGKVSYSSDVYAFGITLWEMATQGSAFHGLDQKAVVKRVLAGKRPTFPDWIPCTGLEHLYLSCVGANPAERPTAEQVVSALSAMEAQVRASAPQRSAHHRESPAIVTSTFPSSAGSLRPATEPGSPLLQPAPTGDLFCQLRGQTNLDKKQLSFKREPSAVVPGRHRMSADACTPGGREHQLGKAHADGRHCPEAAYAGHVVPAGFTRSLDAYEGGPLTGYGCWQDTGVVPQLSRGALPGGTCAIPGAGHQHYTGAGAGYAPLFLPDQLADGSQSNPGQIGPAAHPDAPASDFQYLSM